MGKTKSYYEWLKETRQKKLKVVKGLLKAFLFAFDLII